MVTYYLKDEVFEKIFLLLKENKTIYCNHVKKVRIFLESVYYMMRTGCQWSELPSGYGLAKSVHKRLSVMGKKRHMGSTPICHNTKQRHNSCHD